ncbi:acyl-CoA thioesterase [Halorubrum sp. HHNYT27]|uniref:acyl-CoA thioesterase n=1 Tax=Halorubrum sp. HHNYT27 TaxID=3402275 RepID=UPI003EBAAC08
MTTYTTEIDVRFRDIDAMGHVNNAVYATYLEQARTEYYRDVLDADLSRVSSVLASLSLDFRRPVELADSTVTVDVDVTEIGRSSVTMTYEFRVDDAVVAEGETTLVSLDPDSGEPVPIPPAFREEMMSYHEL